MTKIYQEIIRTRLRKRFFSKTLDGHTAAQWQSSKINLVHILVRTRSFDSTSIFLQHKAVNNAPTPCEWRQQRFGKIQK